MHHNKHMIKECNFKSKIRHRSKPRCQLTPTEDVCLGEENFILYQIYKNFELSKKNQIKSYKNE